jgi:hypothetical protein
MLKAVMGALLMAALCVASITVDARPRNMPPPGPDGIVRLIIAYCPTDFTGAGAIVNVDPVSGEWQLETIFKFPSEIFGCIANYDPTYSFDTTNPNVLWFDFTSEDGYFVRVDWVNGTVETINSASMFFTGFEDFAEFPTTQTLRGITGTVTESGYCSDACLGFGVQDVSPGDRKYKRLSTLPFKETADDARYIDWQQNVMYFQAAYDLNSVGCAPVQWEQCMLAVDVNTGALLNATYNPAQYQVFKYARGISDDGTVRAFMNGYRGFCNQTKNNSATVFGTVNVKTAAAQPLACVPDDVVIDMDQWVASYSRTESVLATASGNGYGDPPQFITFNVSTGAVIANTELSGLAQALKADMKLIFVWGAEFTW